VSIVGVHGVGNYKVGIEPDAAAEALAAIWRRSLRGNAAVGALIDDVPISVAYYADLLRKPGKQSAEDGIEQLDEDALQALDAWMELFDDEVGEEAGDSQGYATFVLRRDFSEFARRRGIARAVLSRFAAWFFGEVTRYLAGPQAAAREAVRARVAAQLRAAEPPLIVIAHSLGSVVAYETLWANQDIDVQLLVTLGSPLAMPHVVFPKLQPAAQQDRGLRPPGVREWVNYADVGDLVAIPPKGVGSSFDGVDDRETAIHLFDFHLAGHYLAARKVGTCLLPRLRAAE